MASLELDFVELTFWDYIKFGNKKGDHWVALDI